MTLFSKSYKSMSFKRISIDEANAMIGEKELTLADVRDPESYAEGRIPNAINILNANLGDFLKNGKKDQPLLVYCYHGNSSQGAAEYFYQNGFKEVYSVDGGYEAWKFCL
jgi:thiosulfate sulfurtransferase